MANKQIKDLTATSNVNPEDVFMLQAPDTRTLKVSAENLKGYLNNAVDPEIEAQIYRMQSLSVTFESIARQPELKPFLVSMGRSMGPVMHLDNALVRTARNLTIGKVLDSMARQPEAFDDALEDSIIELIGPKLDVFDINLEYSQNIVIGYLNEAAARQPEALGRMANFVTRATNLQLDDYTPPVIIFNDSVVGNVLTINLADWNDAFTPADFSGAAIAIITDDVDGIITTTPTVKFINTSYTEVAEITPTTPNAPFTAHISIADHYGNVRLEYIAIQLE